MRILLLSDIHANFPAIQAVEQRLHAKKFDLIINCGDSLVYGPFPNETMEWLQRRKVISILGNTDKKVVKLLKDKDFRKPANPEKRIMYTWTAEHLKIKAKKYLLALKKKNEIKATATDSLGQHEYTIGIYHGSPARPHEFLFRHTADEYFVELAKLADKDLVVCGHSHDPFHKFLGNTHFINPGSCGRMFDGNPAAACATVELSSGTVTVKHYRVDYEVTATVAALRRARLPEIYTEMFLSGKKTN